MTAAEELLARLNQEIARLLSEREQRVSRTRAFWDGKPRTLLNDRLERIELDKHYAQCVLESAALLAEREEIIDALTQLEMTKPISLVLP